MRSVVLSLLLLGASCGGAGIGKGVRSDIRQTMTSAEPDLAKCYGEALTSAPGIAGTVEVGFLVAPKSGKFSKVLVRKKLGNDALEACVVKVVGGLKLAKPQPLPVLVESYPLEFTAAQ